MSASKQSTFQAKIISKLIDVSLARVGQLAKEGILTRTQDGTYHITAVTEYIRFLRSRKNDENITVYQKERQKLILRKQKLEIEKLQKQVEVLNVQSRDADKEWIHHDDHCGALAVMLATLKDSLQHHCTMAAPDLADVCSGDKQQAPILAEKAVDLIVGPAFNDLAGERIENAIFDVYSEDGGEESDGE